MASVTKVSAVRWVDDSADALGIVDEMERKMLSEAARVKMRTGRFMRVKWRLWIRVLRCKGHV